jgi:hypothetical protein
VELVPLLFLSCDKNKHEICADGEVHSLIGDNHGVKVRFEALQAFVDHGNEVCANGVHLGVKFAAEDAVAEINQAGAGVALDFFSGIF